MGHYGSVLPGGSPNRGHSCGSLWVSLTRRQPKQGELLWVTVGQSYQESSPNRGHSCGSLWVSLTRRQPKQGALLWVTVGQSHQESSPNVSQCCLSQLPGYPGPTCRTLVYQSNPGSSTSMWHSSGPLWFTVSIGWYFRHLITLWVGISPVT